MTHTPEVGAGLRVHVKTLGCKVNRVESNRFATDLMSMGVTVSDIDDATVVVINTCTVTGEADAKARKAVRQALKAARHPVVVVTGCLAALDAGGLREMDRRVVVEADKERVVTRVVEILGIDPHQVSCTQGSVACGTGFRTRGSIKVQDGCDNRCTYCIVPDARGLPRATPLRHVVAEAEQLVSAGVAEIVLTGINIGRYRDGDADLASVVSRVADTGVRRIRLSSIEPPDLTQRLLDVLAFTPAVCEHLHVPLQSGSDRILSAMGRHYDAARYLELIGLARSAVPGLAVTTDVIAGFPGETDADHRATVDLVTEARFSKLHVFRYSVRPGTPAAALVQLDPAVRSSRAAELRDVGAQARASFIQERSGSRAEVLVEESVGERWRGTTRDYLRVTFQACDPIEVVEVVEVDLSEAACE